MNELKQNISENIISINSSNDLAVTDAASIVAINLYYPTQKETEAIQFRDITFRDTEMNSDFSDDFALKIRNEYTRISKNKIESSISNRVLTITYDIEDAVFLRLTSVLTGKNNTAFSVRLKLSNIEKEVIPYNFYKISLVEKIGLSTENKELLIKTNMLAYTAIVSNIHIPDSVSLRDRLPFIVLNTSTNDTIAKIFPNDSLKIHFFFKTLKISKKPYQIVLKLNIIDFLGLKHGSEFAKRIEKKGHVPALYFTVKVSGPSIYSSSFESNIGNSLDIPIVEPQLKKIALGKGYEFTEIQSESDYILNITGETRAGSNASGIAFSYLDITVTLLDARTHNEIYNKSFANYKAGADSFQRAGTKAYESVAKEYKTDFERILIDLK